MNRRKHVAGFVAFFGVFIFLSLNWHSHSPKFTYHGEIWADRAGYHVYLPAAFDYGFDPEAFPAGIAQRTGNGFELDSIPGRVTTKYPCGEALLRIPFYLIGKLLRDADDPLGAGFTLIDHAMVDVAASFYGTLGLFLLFLVLKRREGGRAAALAAFCILMGTNLFYYLVGDPGMSHVYSFFLFAAFIHVLDKASRSALTRPKVVLLGVIAGLILVTRPTNILFLPLAMAITAPPSIGVAAWVRNVMKPRYILPMAVGVLLLCLPQMAYWQYAFGTPVKWSYGHEGFTRLADPPLLHFWFSPYNGLFPYSPLIAIILLLGTLQWRKMAVPVTVSWITLFAVSYLSASWHAWTFGCGFGARNLVEYTVVFAFPLAVLFGKRNPRRMVAYALAAACCMYTFKLTYSYPTCWFGDVWDWPRFANLLFGPFL